MIKPAGFENSQGIVSTSLSEGPVDPQWKNDPAMKAWNASWTSTIRKPTRKDASVVYAYSVAQTLVQVLKQCGDDLTRENVMKQAASLKNFELGLLLPGIKINTRAKDFAPIEQMQLMRFKGESWELFGEIISGELSN